MMKKLITHYIEKFANHVRDKKVCCAIYECLCDEFLKTPRTPDEWLAVTVARHVRYKYSFIQKPILSILVSENSKFERLLSIDRLLSIEIDSLWQPLHVCL